MMHMINSHAGNFPFCFLELVGVGITATNILIYTKGVFIMEKDDLEIADIVDDLIRRGYIDHTMREVWIKKMKKKKKSS